MQRQQPKSQPQPLRPPPRKYASPPIPIAIPRAEHLHLPLTPDLRADLSTLLMASGTITTLKERLDATCADAGWPENVHARALQLLRESGGTIGAKRLQEVLLREALGQKDEDDEEEEEEEGREGVEWGHGGRRRKREVVVKVADVAVPERVREVSRKVVRDGMEGAEVVVKRELTDGWVV